MTISMHGLKLDGIVWNHTVREPVKRDRPDRAPHYISDHMDATWHPMTGQIIDSKGKFRQITRERGGLEVGNEKFPPPERPKNTGAGRDIKMAIEKLKSDRNR
jgi:hypothetical protein